MMAKLKSHIGKKKSSLFFPGTPNKRKIFPEFRQPELKSNEIKLNIKKLPFSLYKYMLRICYQLYLLKYLIFQKVELS